MIRVWLTLLFLAVTLGVRPATSPAAAGLPLVRSSACCCSDAVDAGDGDDCCDEDLGTCGCATPGAALEATPRDGTRIVFGAARGRASLVDARFVGRPNTAPPKPPPIG